MNKIVLINKKRTRLNIKLDLWMKVLEDKGFKVVEQKHNTWNVNLVRVEM